MLRQSVLHIVLTLLVAAGQVAGVAIPEASATTPDTGAYFCCCIGTCSCTGDCCNHPPAGGGEEASAVRIESGGPGFEAPRSCGAWRATLQRPPDHGKVVADHSRARFAAPPASPRLHSFQNTTCVSSEEDLRPSSPRAPPFLPVRT